MCWNAEVSLQSFLFGMSFIGIGAYAGVRLPILLFCITIVMMQLIEYIVWSNYDNKYINTKASQAALFLLFLQPIASMIGLPNITLRNNLLGSYILLNGLSLFMPWNIDFSMTRAKNGHLSWNWLTNEPRTWISLSIYFFFLFIPLVIQKNYELLFLALATLGLSLYSFWTENTWGSMWCWIVNGLVPISIGNAVFKMRK